MTRAVVAMAYGTPASSGEIEAYYTDIRRGRPPTPEQLADLTARYEAIGGLSPLAAHTAAQRDALQAALDELAPGEYIVALGNKHAAPTIETAVDEVVAQGVDLVVGLALAPHYSAMSVGEYLGRLRAATEGHGLKVVGIESWAVQPAYVSFLAGEVRRSLAEMPPRTTTVFTAHSLPKRVSKMATRTPTRCAPRPWRSPTPPTCPRRRRGRRPGRAPDGLRNRGWDRTSSSSSIVSPTPARQPACSSAPAVSSPIISRCSTTSTSKRAATPNRRGLAFARTASVNDDPAVMGELASRLHAAAGG